MRLWSHGVNELVIIFGHHEMVLPGALRRAKRVRRRARGGPRDEIGARAETSSAMLWHGGVEIDAQGFMFVRR